MKTLIVVCASVMAAVAVPTAELYQSPVQVQDINIISGSNTDSLGFLEPQTIPQDDDFTAIMLDLLPEFTGVLKKFGGAQGAQLSPTEAVSVFFPIVRKALEAKAQSEGRTLTNDEERLLSLSESSIKLSTGVIENLSVNGSASDIITNVMSITKPIMEANALGQGRTLTQKEEQEISQIEGGVKITIQAMEDMAKDNSTAGFIASTFHIARFALQERAKAQHRTFSWEEEHSLNQVGDAINTAVEIMQDFNSLGNNVAEMVPTFMRFSRFLYEARARNESRMISWKEEEQLRFTKRTLTNALGFIQEMATGTASEESLKTFMTTTRKMFEQRALNRGRSSLDNDIESNLKFTEHALNLALSAMREAPQPIQNQQNVYVHPHIL